MPKAEEGESTRGGLINPPLIRGAWGPPPRIFLNFERFYVRFLMGFYAFGTRF